MPLYDYLTPKLDFKRKFNHRNYVSGVRGPKNILS